MWKQCLHSPTIIGQSSPGNLHLLHVPSKLTRQIPQVSSDSSGRSHFQVATARKELMVTFMMNERSKKSSLRASYTNGLDYDYRLVCLQRDSYVKSNSEVQRTDRTEPPARRKAGQLANDVLAGLRSCELRRASHEDDREKNQRTWRDKGLPRRSRDTVLPRAPSHANRLVSHRKYRVLLCELSPLLLLTRYAPPYRSLHPQARGNNLRPSFSHDTHAIPKLTQTPHPPHLTQ